MDRKRLNIAIIEPSRIIYEGLENMILKAKRNSFVYGISDFTDLDQLMNKTCIDIVIINPCMVHNRLVEFARIKQQYPVISWISLVYAHYDVQLLHQFQDTISILDTTDTIVNKLEKPAQNASGQVLRKQLSEREVDVLTQLVNGLSNKEIAEALCISVHTVISHRKNIVEKTGIRSLPGLTIFAISQKITSVNSKPQ